MRKHFKIEIRRQNMASQLEKTRYQEYVKENSPKTNLPLQMGKAFIMGGIICCVGQFILNIAINNFELEKDIAASWCSVILILTSAILTGFNQYGNLVKWGGAGALVPITGFANSVVSSAIEYKTEGQVFGIGCKIFTIAGPVILYGIFTSWCLGVIYWISSFF
jgi:stage V sporulation protein AC